MIEQLPREYTEGEYIVDSQPIRSAWETIPRSGTVGPGGLTACRDDTFLPVPVEQINRLKNHYVLMLINAQAEKEFVHVCEPPTDTGLIITRARGGSEPIALSEGDLFHVIGIAMPENQDFPL